MPMRSAAVAKAVRNERKRCSEERSKREGKEKEKRSKREVKEKPLLPMI
jgi:hypothetical protein